MTLWIISVSTVNIYKTPKSGVWWVTYAHSTREPFVGTLEDGWGYKPRMNSKTPYHPYICVLKKPYHKRMPAAELRLNQMLQNCNNAVPMKEEIWKPSDYSQIFSPKVSIFQPLPARRQQKRVESHFGQGPGQVFLGFLETIQIEQIEGEDVAFRYHCRLCPIQMLLRQPHGSTKGMSFAIWGNTTLG